MAEARSTEIRSKMETPEPLVLHLLLEIRNVLTDHAPAIAVEGTPVFTTSHAHKLVEWFNLFFGKTFDPVNLLLEFRFDIKINHGGLFC